MQLTQPNDTNRQALAPKTVSQAMRPPSGKSSGAMPGGGPSPPAGPPRSASGGPASCDALFSLPVLSTPMTVDAISLPARSSLAVDIVEFFFFRLSYQRRGGRSGCERTKDWFDGTFFFPLLLQTID